MDTNNLLIVLKDVVVVAFKSHTSQIFTPSITFLKQSKIASSRTIFDMEDLWGCNKSIFVYGS